MPGMRRDGKTCSLRPRSAMLASLWVLVIGGCSAGSAPPATVATGRAVHVRHVDVGGYRLDVECEGEGSPTVVFASGAGDDRSAFAAQVAELGRITRVCAYDRAGIGSSDHRPAAGSITVGDLADELVRLLDGADIDDRIVLVGHSLGGGVAQLFADRYPDRVAGLVFVDSMAIPGYVDWFGAQLEDGTRGTVDMAASTREWEQTGAVGSTPTVVLTQGFTGDDSSVPWEFRDYLLAAHRQLAARSTNAVHVIAVTSGHLIQHDAPGLVTAAIEEVVRAVRSGHALSVCDDRFEAIDGACA